MPLAKPLVIFDIDGTLFQTDCVTVPAVQRTFSHYGLPTPAKESILSFFGKPVEEYEAWLAEQCPAGLAEEIIIATNTRELELIGSEGKLYPHALETLEQLRQHGFFLAVCSNGPKNYVHTFINDFHLGSYFSTVQARDTQPTNKREMTKIILNQLEPSVFITVGDRADDISAAHAWGGFAIAAAYGFGRAEEHLQADAIINRLDETPPCIMRFIIK